MSKHVLIVGNGVAGVTAARFIRKLSDFRITIVSDETDHFYSRTALMYLYMGQMRYQDVKPYEDWFWEKNRIDLVRGRVTAIDTDGQVAHLQNSPSISYDVLLLATGSRPRRFGRSGQDLQGVQSLYGIPDLEAMERNTRGIRRAAVVGGGLIGVEMAEMLRSRHLPVVFLVREASYMDYILPPEESSMVNEEIRRHGVDLVLGTGLGEIRGDSSGRVSRIVATDTSEFACEFVGITTGVVPRIDFVKASSVEVGQGILVNEYFETSIPGIYAAGDCAEFRDPAAAHRPIEQLWYTARKHGETVGRTIAGHRTSYHKGLFFNSAKFFDLEYQTYGDVLARPRPDQETFCWRDPKGRRLLRINYDAETGAVAGFNALGVRLRQEICERWIVEERPIGYALSNMEAASFDPEFTRSFSKVLLKQYERERPAAYTGEVVERP